LNVCGEVSLEVRNASEYQQAREHAEALGFSSVDHRFDGRWQSDEGDTMFVNGSSWPVRKVESEYFYVEIDTDNGKEVCPVKPLPGWWVGEPGTIRMTFTP